MLYFKGDFGPSKIKQFIIPILTEHKFFAQFCMFIIIYLLDNVISMRANIRFYNLYEGTIKAFKHIFYEQYGEETDRYNELLHQIQNMRETQNFKLGPHRTDESLGLMSHYFRSNSPALFFFRQLIPKQAYSAMKLPEKTEEEKQIKDQAISQSIASVFAKVILEIAMVNNYVDETRSPPKDEHLETSDKFGVHRTTLSTKSHFKFPESLLKQPPLLSASETIPNPSGNAIEDQPSRSIGRKRSRSVEATAGLKLPHAIRQPLPKRCKNMARNTSLSATHLSLNNTSEHIPFFIGTGKQHLRQRWIQKFGHSTDQTTMDSV